MPRLSEFPPFRPHPLIAGPHVQTVLAAYLPTRNVPYRAQRHVLPLADGDTLVLHDDRPPAWRSGDRAVLMLHGLGGSYLSPYMPRVADKLNARGFRTFRLDMRGCGESEATTQYPGHAGRSEDAAAAAEHIADLCPGSPLTIVGFSMGGNIILKMLGEQESLTPGNVDSGVALAPPIDIQRCSRHMLLPKNRLYTRAFSRALFRKVRRQQPRNEVLSQIPLWPAPQNLWEFDSRFTAPLSGFQDANDYYARASAAPLLPRIRVPTLVISAADDPVVPVDVFLDAQFSASTDLLVTTHGGHLGFLGRGGTDPDRRWLDWRIVDWINWVDVGVSRPLAPGQRAHPTLTR